MFLRSLVITTPLDKLWIRMQNGNTDEATWIANINKSIQQLQRSECFASVRCRLNVICLCHVLCLPTDQRLCAKTLPL